MGGFFISLLPGVWALFLVGCLLALYVGSIFLGSLCNDCCLPLLLGGKVLLVSFRLPWLSGGACPARVGFMMVLVS